MSEPIDDKRLSAFQSGIAACKHHKRSVVPDWDTNIDYRRGKPFKEDSDHDRVAVNVDAPLTKAKHAGLFSQVPQVVLTPKHPAFAPAAPIFAKALNEELTRAGIGSAMDEVLPDMINASGVAAILTAYESITDMVDMPVDPSMLPPEQQMAVMMGQAELPTQPTQRTLDARFTSTRISPRDLLWPMAFKGSDFNKAAWVGRTGRMTWAEAKRTFALEGDARERVVSDGRAGTDAAVNDADRSEILDTQEVVTFDEVWYWRHLYHEDETSFTAIHHLVFVDGISKPVIDQPWSGQRYDEATGRYLGSRLPPLQFCTLTVLSDEPVPPSDTAIGRPQVDELIKSRTQMVLQREHSTPIRAFDALRVDPDIRDALMRGTWQGMLPTKGSPENVFKEIARASHPSEDFAFDKTIKTDLQEQWGLGANQMGSFASGERSASEAAIVQSNTQSRIGQERARVVDLLLRSAQVLAGLMALYGEFEVLEELGATLGPDGVQRLQSWDRTRINHEFGFTVRADASVLLDVEQQIARLNRLVNMIGKAPGVNAKPLLEKMVALHGEDPADIVGDPQPPAPEQAAISYRFSGEELLTNPIALAMAVKTGQAPTPDELAAAAAMQKAAWASASVPPIMPPTPGDPAGAPPVGVMPPSAAPGNLPTSQPPRLPQMYDAQPAWQLPDRINTRRDAGGE